jgi:hypothetical protein
LDPIGEPTISALVGEPTISALVGEPTISAFGGEPKKLDPYTVEIPVVRINRPDFVHQLLPAKDEAARVRGVAETNKQIRATSGKHFDYDVLNRAFQAMIPETTRWVMHATVNAP